MSFSNKLGSYPSQLIIISLTISLFLIGLCGWMAISARELIKYVKQNIEIQVDINDNLNQSEIEQIKTELLRLNVVEAPENIKYISKEAASEIFFKDSKNAYQDILEDNPFKNSFSVRVKESLINNKSLAEIKHKIQKIKNVYEVDYAQDFLEGIIINVNKIYKIIASVVIIFFAATLLLINNTIKLALHSQRFIIRTMQLVGATDWFIQKPFFIKGCKQGFVSAIISIILVFITKSICVHEIEGIAAIQINHRIIFLFIVLLILGPIIGALSTLWSVSRYHQMDLDKLI